MKSQKQIQQQTMFQTRSMFIFRLTAEHIFKYKHKNIYEGVSHSDVCKTTNSNGLFLKKTVILVKVLFCKTSTSHFLLFQSKDGNIVLSISTSSIIWYTFSFTLLTSYKNIQSIAHHAVSF